ncbi:TatD family hydrolase [Nitrosophilus alvini]|uniref:TatD family hydrolase n=1 Tax=Nitrosophilus alvini TaxID=2714855 RepID=UPI00190A739F|nr:TatD family hydrolase [Nitrosophilus alvini]
MIIDTHCHLDDKRFDEDIHEVIKRAREKDVKGFLIPGADPDDLERARELSYTYEGVFFAVGVHPYEWKKYDEERLREFAKDEKCIAIGECGLDYYRLPDDEKRKIEEKENQKAVFKAQIALAKELKKPLIIHIRDASFDSREILIKEGAQEVGGVLHCYNASPMLLDMAERNFYFGIGGVITFQNAKKLVQILPEVPREKILIETDAPYLTPHPFRGKRNEPAYTVYIAEKIAEILNMDFDEVCELTTRNAKTLFREFDSIN